MRKRFYIFVILVSCIVNAVAQQDSRRLKMPVPGVGIKQLYGNAHHSQCQAPKMQRQSMPARCSVRILKPRQQAASPRKAEQMVKKTLLTGWEEVYENLYPNVYTNHQTGTVTYDKYGHFQTVDFGVYKYVYEYEYGIGGRWTKKTVTMTDNGSARIESKEERTLDDQGRVLTIKCYEANTDDENYELVLVEEKEYDYAHDPKGVLVKHVDYDTWEPSRVEEQLLRKWFEPLQAYVECEDGYGRFCELSVEATKYIVKSYSYNDETKAYDELSDLYEYYFTEDGRDAGWYHVEYYYGEVESEEGEKYLYTDNAPQAGYTTKVTQKIGDVDSFDDFEDWTYTTKEEYSNNYDDPLIPGSGNRYRKEYDYDTDTRSWTLAESVSKEWAPQGYLKETYQYYGEDGGDYDRTTVEICMYDSNGENIGYVYEFSDGGYVVETDEWNESNASETDFYNYYDKSGKLIRQLKVVANDEKTSATMGDVTTYELKNGTWTIVTGVIKIGDGAWHLEAEFDSKGRVIRSDEYNADNQLQERWLYTYTDNGYTEEEYMLLDGKLYKTCIAGISLDAYGTLSDWYIYYNILGNAMEGRKQETYANGKFVTYSYNTETGQFVYSYSDVSSYYNVAPDGTRTIIYRELDADGNILETEKQIDKSTEGYYLTERYVKQDGKWVGTEKHEEFTVRSPSFYVNPVPDPLEYHDEYFFPDDDDVPSTSNEASRIFVNRYEWLNDAWTLQYGENCAYVLDGNTLTTTYTYTGYNPYDGSSHKQTEITVQTCDDNRNLVAQTNSYETIETEGEERSYHASKTEYTYEYNSEQLLTSTSSCDYMDETGNGMVQYSRTSKTYVYSPIDVVGIKSATSNGTARFALDGRTLSATSGTISVYAPDGTLVAEGSRLTLPSSGIYIVVSGNSRSKIVVR